MTTFVAFYRPGPNWSDHGVREQAARLQREYLHNAVGRGLVSRAGGLDEDGELLVMLVASSLTVAQRFIARDPSVEAGVHTAKVRRFEGEYGLGGRNV